MSYLLWQRAGAHRIASPQLVLRAADVPLLADAQALRDRLEQLHDQAEAQVTAAADAAREGARAEGLAEGRRAAERELTDRVAAIARAAEVEREHLRNEIGALALQVVRKLLGRFAADDVLLALADSAAREILPERPVALVVHPDRADAVRERVGQLDPATAALDCPVRTDPACGRDDCRLETAHGSIDAALDAQLARLEAAWSQQTP